MARQSCSGLTLREFTRCHAGSELRFLWCFDWCFGAFRVSCGAVQVRRDCARQIGRPGFDAAVYEGRTTSLDLRLMATSSPVNQKFYALACAIFLVSR